MKIVLQLALVYVGFRAFLAVLDRLGRDRRAVSPESIARALRGHQSSRHHGVIETRLREADVKDRIKGRWQQAGRDARFLRGEKHMWSRRSA